MGRAINQKKEPRQQRRYASVPQSKSNAAGDRIQSRSSLENGSPDRPRLSLALITVGDRSSVIATLPLSPSPPQRRWPQPLGLPARLIRCSLPQGAHCYI
nr:hypothetical protein CFP56_33098 [Quercus suber]